MSRSTNRSLTIVALLCATFLAAMEATAIVTVMPTIVGDLGGIHLYAWVFTAYMMSATATGPIFGKLADTFGRKPTLQFGIFIFLVGSLGSALSHTMMQLIVARAIQGLGAGAIQPIGITIVGDLYSVRERARTTSIFSTVWAVAGILGPILGALVIQYSSWPWIFYINIPFGLGAMAILHFNLFETIKRDNRNFDIIGAIFLALAVVSLLVGVNQPERSTWLIPLAALFFILLWIAERSSRDPLFPPDLFSKRSISSAFIISALMGATMLATITYLPLYVLGVLGIGGRLGAAVIIPMGVCWPVASNIIARVMTKIGYKNSVLIGVSFMLVGLFIIAMAAQNTMSIYVSMLGMGLLGLGLGCANTPLIISVQASVEWKQRGAATASYLFFRTIGGTISVGFLGGLLATALLAHSELPLDAANKLLGPERGLTLSRETVSLLGHILSGGLIKIFWTTFVLSVLALAAGISFPRIAMKSQGS